MPLQSRVTQTKSDGADTLLSNERGMMIRTIAGDSHRLR